MGTYFFFEIVERPYDRYSWILVEYRRDRRRVIARTNRDYRSPRKAYRAAQRLQRAIEDAEIVDAFSRTRDYRFEVLEDVLPLPVGSAEDVEHGRARPRNGVATGSRAAAVRQASPRFEPRRTEPRRTEQERTEQERTEQERAAEERGRKQAAHSTGGSPWRFPWARGAARPEARRSESPLSEVGRRTEGDPSRWPQADARS